MKVINTQLLLTLPQDLPLKSYEETMSTEAATNDNHDGTSPSAPRAKRVRFSQQTNTSQARNQQGSTISHLQRAPRPTQRAFISTMMH